MKSYKIAVFILVLVVACSKRSEPGLMESGKSAHGADLDGDGKSNDIHWDLSQGPIQVEISPNLPADYRNHLIKAISEINRMVGAEVFTSPALAEPRYATKVEVGGSFPRRRTIFVYGDGGSQPERGSTTYYNMDDGRLEGAVVQLPETVVDWANRYSITLHEMLHAIGFDHDPDPKSVMYSKMVKSQQSITEHDVALARKVYGKDS